MEAINKHLIKALISQDKAAPLIGCLHDGRGVFSSDQRGNQKEVKIRSERWEKERRENLYSGVKVE